MAIRRRFVIALGLGALAPFASLAPLAGFAQQPAKIPRVGFIEPLSKDSPLYRAFLQGMRDLGYVEGRNLTMEARFADSKPERLPALADELGKLKVDIIVAMSTPAVQAAKQATTTIPIVMIAIADPVGSGFVANLARPGGNITGLSNVSADTSRQLLEMLKDAVPKLSRVAVMVNPANSSNGIQLKNINVVAPKMGVKILAVEARNAGEIESAFATMVRQRPDALIVVGDPTFRQQARQIADLALRHKLPTTSMNSALAEAGGLFGYGASISDTYRRAATYVDKILKGAKPGDLPVEQPTLFEFVFNKKTAKALGIKFSNTIQVQATRVIE